LAELFQQVSRESLRPQCQYKPRAERANGKQQKQKQFYINKPLIKAGDLRIYITSK
jgi:hypothetical protein